ncbi:PREDICTED: ATP synthase subunit e, mitochondrial [Nipponia nippon]|uniref:ATP synthase subunit e, mitochondrial n=1 Tax=Nipponia nippon TaxID=128390 RepID=UPI000510AB10|nr:PREDICTED: ATP synthase subunit e, mitochondrial [Nipponia nippon]
MQLASKEFNNRIFTLSLRMFNFTQGFENDLANGQSAKIQILRHLLEQTPSPLRPAVSRGNEHGPLRDVIAPQSWATCDQALKSGAGQPKPFTDRAPPHARPRQEPSVGGPWGRGGGAARLGARPLLPRSPPRRELLRPCRGGPQRRALTDYLKPIAEEERRIEAEEKKKREELERIAKELAEASEESILK